MSGLCSMVFTDWFSLSITGCGVLAGASRPIQADSTTLFTPPSFNVGMSGAVLARLSLRMPTGCNLPALMWGRASGSGENAMSTTPPIRSVMAGAPPL